MDTDFGSSLSIANLPKVGAYVSSKMEEIMGEELLIPNGGIISKKQVFFFGFSADLVLSLDSARSHPSCALYDAPSGGQVLS